MFKQRFPIQVLAFLTEGTIKCASVDSPECNISEEIRTYSLTSSGLIEVLDIADYTS